MIKFSDIFGNGNWKHAVGELLLIVVGVTIALWADAWMNERGDRQRESARLVALHADTIDTLDTLEAAIKNADGAKDALRQVLALQAPIESSSEMTALANYAVLYGLDFAAEMSVYEDLKSSGELALLTSADLRQALSRAEASLERLRLLQEDLTTVQQLNVDSYMIDSVDLKAFYSPLLQVESPPDLDLEFMVDPAFQNRMALKLDLVTGIVERLRGVEAQLQTVESLIQAALPAK